MRKSKLNVEHFHIIEVSEILIERLQWVRLKPEYLFCSVDSSLDVEIQNSLKNIYPTSIFLNDGLSSEKKASLVFAIINAQGNNFLSAFPASVLEWKKKLKAGGLLIAGIVGEEVGISEVGDFLLNMGFEDVVIDKEILEDQVEVVCVSAWVSRPVSVSAKSVRRQLD